MNKNLWPGIALVIFLLLTTACSNPYEGYDSVERGIYYKIIAIGDGEERPKKGDRITLRMQYSSMSDSVYYPPKGVRSSSYEFEMQGLDGRSGFASGLGLMHEGDSLVFILLADLFYGDFLNKDKPRSLQDDTIKVWVKLEKITSAERYRADQINYERWRADRELQEQSKLYKYLESAKIDQEFLREGMYYIPLSEGRGRVPSGADIILVHYRGYFIDSTLFDDTYKGRVPLEFQLGKPDQVIKGMETGIRMMKKGGKARFIIPSNVGFGEDGSSVATIPPFTTVIYEVELIDIIGPPPL